VLWDGLITKTVEERAGEMGREREGEGAIHVSVICVKSGEYACMYHIFACGISNKR